MHDKIVVWFNHTFWWIHSPSNNLTAHFEQSQKCKRVWQVRWMIHQMHFLRESTTAELLAGARALSFADRHHFELNLSDLLDKSTQHKKNWLLNVIAARQRFERQQANFEGIQTLSITNSKLIKWMTIGRASWCSPSTLPPWCPIPWAHLSPQLAGTKDSISSAEDNQLQSLWKVKLFAGISNSHDVHMTLQPLHKPPNESIKTAPTRQINPSKLQHNGVPTM